MRSDTRSNDPLLSKAEDFRRERSLYTEGQHLLLALSGGKDSVCLLRLLLWQRERLGLKLSALTVNHGLRPQAEAEVAFCRGLCEKNAVDFYSVRVDAAAFARRKGIGLEEAGRLLRYEELSVLSERIGAHRILTAHTASDQCETVLMRLSRGAGLSGLCGIPPKRGSIVRPLLCATSEEVLAALSRWEQPWCRDESNGEDGFFRNRVRHRWIPPMKEENPSFEETVARNALILREEKELLEALCDEALKGVLSADGLRADRKKLCALCEKEKHRALFSRVISRACRSLGVSMPPAERCAALREAALNAPAGKRITFSGGMLLVGAEELVFCRETAQTEEYSVLLRPGRNSLEAIGAQIFLYEEKKDDNYKNINKMLMIMKINSATIVGGLVARNRRAGDRIVINGMHKSVKKLLCDCKLPPDGKEIPVIADGAGILWVPGVGLCDRARPQEGEAFFTVELIKATAFDNTDGTETGFGETSDLGE